MNSKFKKIVRRIICLFTKHKFKRYYTNQEKVDIICENCEKHMYKDCENEFLPYDL